MVLPIGHPLFEAIGTPKIGPYFSNNVSGAAMMLASEAQGLAIDLTDDFFSSTGFYGSAKVLDTGTPANNYDNAPTLTASSFLTYTSPSVKMVMGPSGALRYPAHNLYLNSASPANQAITVVSGATYAVTITGSVSTTASGAATGTWTAGTQTFTAATTTLTFGSTSGSGTVHVRRTPSDSTYLATTSAARYALPIQFTSAGVQEGLLVEEARTNSYTYSNDFSNAAWTKQDVGDVTFATKTTGVDGIATSMSKLTTNGNSAGHDIFQLVTKAASAQTWTVSGFAKAAEITRLTIYAYNGAFSSFAKATYDISGVQMGVAASATGFTSPSATITSMGNSIVRFTLTFTTDASANLYSIFYLDNGTGTGAESITFAGTSGNGLFLEKLQCELGAFATSPIETFASTVTRAADNISLATSAFPTSTSQTFFAQGKWLAALGDNPRWIGIQSNATPLYSGSSTEVGAFDGTDAAQITISDLTTGYRKLALAGDAADSSITADGAAATAQAAIEIAQPTSFFIGSNAGSSSQLSGIVQKIMYLPRRMSNAELQSLTS